MQKKALLFIGGLSVIVLAGCVRKVEDAVNTGVVALERFSQTAEQPNTLDSTLAKEAVFVDPYSDIIDEEAVSLGLESAYNPAQIGLPVENEFRQPLDSTLILPETAYPEADIGLFEPDLELPVSTDLTYESQSDVFTDFERVNFATDSVELTQKAQQTLELQAAWLNANPDALAVIEGHCDERGTQDYNFALGQQRAEAVLEYLVLAGVAEDRLRATSFGKERPLPDALCFAPECWAKNRRAVTVLLLGY